MEIRNIQKQIHGILYDYFSLNEDEIDAEWGVYVCDGELALRSPLYKNTKWSLVMLLDPKRIEYEPKLTNKTKKEIIDFWSWCLSYEALYKLRDMDEIQKFIDKTMKSD